MKDATSKKPWTAKKALIVSFVVMLVFIIMSSVLLRSGGSVSVYTVDVERPSDGAKIATKIFRPDTATAENPAPAILFFHGLGCNKETYSNYALELSRRGFVVVMPDMLAHGESDVTDVFTGGYGTVEVYEYTKALDFVDSSRLGLAGHSAGGAQVNVVVAADNAAEEQSVQAVYLIASDPQYSDGTATYTNFYGNRDVGVAYTRYDHVFFTTTNEAGEVLIPQQYLFSDSAKSLVVGGGDPASFEGESVQPGHFYTVDVDGVTSSRVIYAISDIHASGEVNFGVISGCINLFQNRFENANYIEGAEQIWPLYSFFSFGSLVAMVVFSVFLIKALCTLKFFAPLAPEKAPRLGPAPKDAKGKVWFWGMTILNLSFAILSITIMYSTKYSYWLTPTFPQQMTNVYAFWGAINGVFMLLTILVSYFFYGRKNGATMKSWGLAIGWKNLLKSLLLCLAVAASYVAIVWFSVHVMQTDFRFYMWGITVIPLDSRIGVFFTYLPLFMLLCIPMAISVNSTYYQKIAGEPEWVNDIFFAVINAIPAILITAVGFHIFIKNGFLAGPVFGSTYTHTYTINAIPMFPLVVLGMRRMRKVCSNPYVPGILMAVLLCWMNVSCNVTCFMTYFGY